MDLDFACFKGIHANIFKTRVIEIGLKGAILMHHELQCRIFLQWVSSGKWLDIYDALKRLPFHHYYCSLGQLISLQASESSDFLEVMNLFLKMSYLKILIFQLFLTLTLCWL